MKMNISLKLLKRLNVIIQLSTIWPILPFLQHAIKHWKEHNTFGAQNREVICGGRRLFNGLIETV